jgi:hypothetical protein
MSEAVMTPRDGAVRVLVRETAIGRYYASSSDLLALHAYGRSEAALATEIQNAIREIYSAQGQIVAASPATPAPQKGEWIWHVEQMDEEFRTRAVG